MIYSMTAYARIEQKKPSYHLVCEMRSINHRYLEMSLHLPDVLRVLEMPIRECIRDLIKRGKVECSIRYQRTSSNENNLFKINEELAQELCRASERITQFLKQPGPISPIDILKFSGVLEPSELDQSKMQEEILELIKKTVEDLMAAREREGSQLNQLFLTRIHLMQEELNKVKSRLPAVNAEARERLMKRFSDAKLELDPVRLEQEMLMFAQKIDVAEEIDRTETHLSEVRRVLKNGGSVGRRLDFLLQELNREANTLGSKSADPVITHAAVEMKVLIEQIREQVQNVE